MKKKYLMIIIIALFIILIPNVKAVSKEDIISLSYNIKTCNSKTKALLNGSRSSYSRLLNERNVSQKNLNKIYNNIQKAITLLDSNGICSTEQKNTIPESLKNKLYSLYKESNDLILSSPKITDNKVSETKMIVDSTTNEIKIYEKGSVIDVIKTDEKLNYVGLNKTLMITIGVMLFMFVGIIVLFVLKKYNSVIIGVFYVLLLFLPLIIIFRNQASVLLDTVESMRIESKKINKKIETDGKKIISYPIYSDEYATIYINDKNGKIYFGDSTEILKKGIGQASYSYLPGEGKTTVLSGHNTGVFSELFNLKKENMISIETIYGKFNYKVVEIDTIKNTDSLKNDFDLVMYTCSPNIGLYGNKRLIVYAKLLDSKWVGE